MAVPALQLLSLTPPTAGNRTLHTALLPSSPNNNILNPSISISFSFHNNTQEVFLGRITHRDLAFQDDGSVVASVPNVPVFKRDGQGNERVTEIKVYAWKGEKLLGE